MNNASILNNTGIKTARPEILAPAGGRKAFLAALAAGADAVYCGLKQLSARMASENFTIEDLIPLTHLAHDQGAKVYITINSLVKPDELDQAGRILDRLNQQVKPDALIIQDLSIISLARQVGFSGEIHLSTLANVSFPEALRLMSQFPSIKRVVLPREISIDEIRTMAKKCPEGRSLEVFVHGALCYGVSGRCYWSSFLGGKSGLRGRCVQPCRRIYEQKGERRRFFSCNDLWTDVLTKLLVNIPKISGLKIEGRKKGPHYVYYTVAAYRLFRDHGSDPKAKKTALAFLQYALGRKGTHYNLLPQRPQNPIDVDIQTGSGMMVGRTRGAASRPYTLPHEELLPNDLLRVGYEDDAFHATIPVNKYIPKKSKFFLKITGQIKPKDGTPVFLIDRRDSELGQRMTALSAKLKQYPSNDVTDSSFKTILPRKTTPKFPFGEMTVSRNVHGAGARSQKPDGLWLSLDPKRMDMVASNRRWHWLPPVIWPDDEGRWQSLIKDALAKRCTRFVLNAPWQIALFSTPGLLQLWAGPFCNIANPLAIENLAKLGFSGVIVSPELGKKDYTQLPDKSPLPLGIVISGNWPLSISRTVSDRIETGCAFTSPRGEQSWVCRYGPDVWVFPNWKIDLSEKREQLKNLGYRLFVHMQESLPKQVHIKKRPGIWNWDTGLM